MNRFVKSPTALLAMAGVFSLQACGGGGSGAADNGSNYVMWANNSNGTVILDAQNQRLAVSKTDRSIVFGNSEITLSGTRVDSNGNITYNGVYIGTVSPTTSTTGSTIATVKCVDGSALSFSVSQSGWNYTCASASVNNPGSSTGSGTGSSGSSNTGSGSPTTPSETIEPATHCISVSREANRWSILTNTCSYPVTVNWCYVGSSDCKYGTWGMTNTINIAPGDWNYASAQISNSNQYDIRIIACQGVNRHIAEQSESSFVCRP